MDNESIEIFSKGTELYLECTGSWYLKTHYLFLSARYNEFIDAIDEDIKIDPKGKFFWLNCDRHGNIQGIASCND